MIQLQWEQAGGQAERAGSQAGGQGREQVNGWDRLSTPVFTAMTCVVVIPLKRADALVHACCR
jgi:hypothetical protein